MNHGKRTAYSCRRAGRSSGTPRIVPRFEFRSSLAPTDAASIWQQIAKYPGITIFVGVRQKALVTSCTLVIVPNLTRGGLPYGLIENVVTSANHRKQSHGAAVLRHAIAEAWKHNCYKVMLLTGSKNPATLKFYSDVGFEQNKTGFQIRQLPVREE